MAQFDAQTTTYAVLQGVDLSGKRVFITGVSAGLGVETARALIAHGAFVVGAARNLDKAKAASAAILADKGAAGGMDLVEADLSSLISVRACADALHATGEAFDVVIANAGIMACPFGKTVDGFEMQFATNYLGHFVLMNRIATLTKPGGRLISLSSMAHRISDVDIDDPNFEHKPYQPLLAYGASKTASALFAVEFDRRHRARDICAAAVHPGAIQTDLFRHITPEVAAEAAKLRPSPPPGQQIVRKTVAQGAATTLWAGFIAPSEEIAGKYCEDCHVAERNDDIGGISGFRSYALDRKHAQALWSKSEELVGEKF